MDNEIFIILLDLTIAFWKDVDLLQKFINDIAMLSNLHLSQKQPNKLALFAFGHKIPKLILETSSESSVCGNKVMDLVARYLNESDDLGSLNGNDLAFALSNALCYFNKLQKLDASPNMSGRLCVFSSSHDFSRHYYAFINCAFAAQKLSVPIDICYLEEDNSTLLQQVSHLTDGHFKKIGGFTRNHEKLLPLLISFFSIGQNLRKLMVPPIEDSVDFRATCFCHKKVIEIGYVCSVCLAVFCKFSPVCACCKYEIDVSPVDLLL